MELLIMVGVIVALTILIKVIIVKSANSANFSKKVWFLSGCIGAVLLFFIVYANINAREAEKQVVLALEAQEQAMKNAEEAYRQSELAKTAQKATEAALKHAEELQNRLNNCK